MQKFRKFIQIAKVDEATHTVYGLAASEIPDKDGEIWDFEYGKEAMQKWSQAFLAATIAAGQDSSLGNIRVMHGLDVGGKVTRIDFKEAEKQAWIETEPVNDEVWGMLKRGILTGFSIGGGYAWKKPDGKYTRYGADIAEVSYVDNPCNPEATFAYVKADGSMELRKFAPKDKEQVIKDAATLAKEAAETFASAIEKTVGEEPMTKEEVTKIQEMLSRFNLPFTVEQLQRAAKGDGMTVAEEEALAEDMAIKEKEEKEKSKKTVQLISQTVGEWYEARKATSARLAKSMYDIGVLAQILCYLRELMFSSWYEAAYENVSEGGGDDADMAICHALHEHMTGLVAVLKEMVDEETEELLATPALKTAVSQTTKGDDTQMKHVEELVKAAKSLASHFHKAAEHHMKKAEHHEGMADCHKTMMDHHKAEKADVGDGFHKAAHAFHKAMHGHHEGLHKMHKAFSEHNKKMAEGMDEGAEKTVKAAAADSTELTASISDLGKSVTDGIAAIKTGFETQVTESLSGLPELVKKAIGDTQLQPDGTPTGILKTNGFKLVGRDSKIIEHDTSGVSQSDAGI